MSDTHEITAQNLLRTLPEVLQDDADMAALASTIADALAARPTEIKRVLIYPHMSELDEELLDILAYDLKVDWYDYSASLDVKREIMRNAPRVRRTIGTPGAVKRAVRAMLPNTELVEWFDDAELAQPYTFKLITTDTLTPEVAGIMPNIIASTKNVRSHLSVFRILRDYVGNCYVAIGMTIRQRTVIDNTTSGARVDKIPTCHALAMRIGHVKSTITNETNGKRSLHSTVRVGATQVVQSNVIISNGVTQTKSVRGKALAGAALAVQTHITIKGE